MRGLVATTAVLGVLAIGGLPVLALTLAVDETRSDREPVTVLEEGHGPDGHGPDGRGGPPWAQGEDREPPPGWVRNHGGATPHGWAVREWAHCRNDARRQADADSCGDKPTPPGHLKKAGTSEAKDKGSKDKPPKPPKPEDDGTD